jgi:hypothetical protein
VYQNYFTEFIDILNSPLSIFKKQNSLISEISVVTISNIQMATSLAKIRVLWFCAGGSHF